MDYPSTFGSDLACFVNILPNFLSDLDNCKDAFTALRESVGPYRKLTMNHPFAFHPDPQ